MKGRMREVIAEEMPDQEDDFAYNHEIFLRGYKEVNPAKHNRFDPVRVERSKRGDPPPSVPPAGVNNTARR